MERKGEFLRGKIEKFRVFFLIFLLREKKRAREGEGAKERERERRERARVK